MATKEEQYAQKLLSRADKILAEIDEAYIIQQRGHKRRPMPLFRAEEITLGKTLGTGGFGIVSEISKFTLDPDPPESVEKASDDSNMMENGEKQADEPPPENPPDDPPLDNNEMKASNDDTTTSADKSSSPAANNETNLDPNSKHGDSDHPGTIKQDNYTLAFQTEGLSYNDHVHYDLKKARHFMAKRCIRKGTARYALKRLHGCLTPIERARGMLDLAMEAKYLSVVWHPNIIKLRGVASGSMIEKGFFIILDRLYQTLDQRMNQWKKEEKKYKGKLMGIGKNKKGLHELMVDRMTIAYDLAAAFFYLHENRLIYRDIKPENIGFDLRGDVKVFDFGLCKSLSANIKARDGGYGYRLTGRAGSLPYMAPEVVRMETYDTKCDVFSFAVLLWEILALQPAFDGMSPVDFVEKVVVEHERLPVSKQWPALTRLMIPEAWDNDPRKRPDMKRVAILIRGDLNDMTSDDRVLHRTKHMDERSDHSMGFSPDEESLAEMMIRQK